MGIINGKKKKLFLDELKSKIKKAKVISFDIFDTLLIRPYIKPTDLFLHIEKAFNCNGFALERRDAERRCRIRHRELEDITFDMIYDEIDEEFKHLKQKEMDWEEMVLRPNPELKQVYDYALKLNKKIIIVSDMYMPSDFLAKVLRKNGFDGFEKLYVSSDLALTKSHGTIWNKIIEELNIKPAQMLHIGDNERSDFNSPSKHQIKAVLYTRVLNQFIKEDKRVKQFIENTQGALGASILAGFLANKWQENRCNNIKQDYWSWIGYNYAGPLNYAYARFVEQDVKQNDINNVMFVAREGYILKQVFEKFNTGIKTNYVYAQRAMNLFCCLDFDRKDINFTSFLVKYFADKNKEIQDNLKGRNFSTSQEYYNFIQQNYRLFEIESKKCADNYKKYIDAKIKTNDKIAAVFDMGRNFSGLKLLRRFSANDIRGIFFVNAASLLDDNNSVWALVNSNKNRIFSKKETKFFTKNWDFVEFLLNSPEASAREIDDNLNPVYSKTISKFEIVRQKIYPQIVENALNFTDEILTLFNGNDVYFEYNTIIGWLNAFIDNPEKIDIENWTNIYFFRLVDNKKPSESFAINISLFEYIFEPTKTKEKILNVFWKTKFQKWYLKNWGIYEEKSPTIEIKRFFGITLYKKRIIGNTKIVTRLLGLLKIKNSPEYKKFYLLGVQVKLKKKALTLHEIQKIISASEKQIVEKVSFKFQRQLTIANLHQKTFGEFRNKHQDETLALVGAGPTVKFIEPLKDVKYVGLNRAFLLDKIKFDYLFTIDKAGLDIGKEQFYDGFLNYDCIKFVGDQNMGKEFQHPQSIMYEKNVRRYKTAARHIVDRLAVDIDTEALMNSSSCSIQAMQFILFTNPKRVYIYGIDCTCASKQHFIGEAFDNETRFENVAINDKIHSLAWRKLKDFANIYYPQTEIIVVNPVGLKGIFKDVYTKSYLQKHPEIDLRDIEILEEETSRI